MKNFRRSLPPLDYLLFFEAVARHGNFTRAAEELNVSQAAVSKRVKVLEEWLGLTLVHRRGRNITLSRNGKMLAANATEALDYLSSGLQQIRRAPAGERLSLAANVAVAQYWLTPRINEYLLGSNAVPVTLTASDKDADLFTLEVDAIFFYGSDIPTGWDGTSLFEEIWLPVAAPSLATSMRGFEDAMLLDFDKLTPKWINWGDFAELTGNTEIAAAPKVNLRSYGSALDTALRGKGVALGCPAVLQFEIEAGRLVALEDYQLWTGRSYFVIWRMGSMRDRTRALLGEVGIRI
ncbi:LysR family transcriptional regulator [Albidovulum sediminicola]|uniref:LysR family transcriptional regulator n=1 Tax=Albidovulum sediminicola TaxID=2984331 RepID=A0ABT2Z0A5_9RHOB|nr:LysR family transcriptional regulator [Defluviimonas sp. WL0075]MCV2864574.1 LysR family transcriptional regulator [Defluviimonas sp. WL0075]